MLNVISLYNLLILNCLMGLWMMRSHSSNIYLCNYQEGGRINSSKFLFLSQARTCIFNDICRGFIIVFFLGKRRLFVLLISAELRNCWQSLLKLSFHNQFQLTLSCEFDSRNWRIVPDTTSLSRIFPLYRGVQLYW